ncbi:MAG: hypothetical protein K8R36_10530 [Planctomycetales bacterium]|nr:hypothetical protein [Planctomycetales bacterium]
MNYTCEDFGYRSSEATFVAHSLTAKSSWSLTLLIAIVAFFLPIALLFAMRPRHDSDRELLRNMEAEAKATSRDALFQTRATHQIMQDFLQSPPPPTDWPAHGLAAYEEKVALCREHIEQFPKYESTFERAVAGGWSPDMESDIRQIANEMAQWAEKMNEVEVRLDAAGRQWREARESSQSLTAEKEKREKGYGLGMSMDGYLFLKDGLSKYEVDLILDCIGEQQAESGNLEIHQWHKGFRRVHCTFRNGGLISKAQFGL